MTGSPTPFRIDVIGTADGPLSAAEQEQLAFDIHVLLAEEYDAHPESVGVKYMTDTPAAGQAEVEEPE